MPTEVRLGENVFREGSSDVGCDGPIPKLLESDQSRELDDMKNDVCPKSMNVLDLSQGNVTEESVGLHHSYRLKDLPVSQKYPELTITGNHDSSENVDAHDLFEADCHEHISATYLHIPKSLSSSANMFALPYKSRDDLSYKVIRKHCSSGDLYERSAAINHCTPVKKVLAPQQFPELLCSQNDYLSQHLDTHSCSVVDNLKESSATDLTSAAQMFSVFTKLSEPSSAGNCEFSDNMRGQHFSLSDSPSATFGEDQSERNQKRRIVPTDFDSDRTAKLPDAINQSPRRWSFRKTKLRQNAEIVKCNRSRRHAGKVLLDLDLSQVPRKRRSGFRKRACASSWGLLSNLELYFIKNSDHHINLNELKKPSRSSGQASEKQEKSHLKNHSEKVRRKRSRRTGGISVKFKLGVGVGPRSMMDVNDEGPLQKTGKIPDLYEEEELTKSMMSQGLKENQKRMVQLSDDTIYDVRNYCEENISNLVPDLGTSPDSEVINLNSGTCLWDNSEEEFHDIQGSSQACLASDGITCLAPKISEETQKQTIMGGRSARDKPKESGIVDNDRQSADRGEISVDVPNFINVSASSSSVFVPGKRSRIDRKPKEQSSSTVADIETPRDIGTEVTPGVDFNLQSPVLHFSAKVHPHSKVQNILKGEQTGGVRKIRSGIHKSANKGLCNSRKKVNEEKLVSKHKLKVKQRNGLTSEAKRQAGAGNSNLAGFGEFGTAKSNLTGDMSTFNVVPRGSPEKSKNPRNAWVLCDDCQKWRRILATLADHIEIANCSWTCKDNVDKNFDSCSIPQEKSDAEINTELEISDGSCDESVWDARSDSNYEGEDQSTATEQSTWKLIKSNKFLHRSQQTQSIDEIMVCHCKPPSDGRRGCGDGCLNRILNIECVQGTCPCGELCSNQQFQNRNYARLKMFKCGKKGYGLQVLDNISEGQFLIEYVGEVLDIHSYEARQRDYAMRGHKHFYFMTLNGSEVIDACAKGNLGRFINHSCDPNCSTEKWMVNGEVCIGLFALKNIKKGEELTFDYNYVRVFGAAAKKCVCGSSQCRGYIGGNSQNTEIVVQDDSEDEYPEPIMVCEDGEVDESYPDSTSPLSASDGNGPMLDNKPQKALDVTRSLDFATSLQALETGISKKIFNSEFSPFVEDEDSIEEKVNPLNTYVPTDLKEDTSDKTEDLCENFARAKVILKQDGISSETLMTGEPECFEARKNMKQSRCSTLEENTARVVPNQLLPDVIGSRRKPKSSLGKGSIKYRATKASWLTTSIKNEKFKSYPVKFQRVQETQGNDYVLSCKPKKEVEVSSIGRFEAVQEKLNELLNPDGGISKRKDASRGYLKLLLLTAASGDNCNGEAIQSNRYLSMILGALLETKSRTVLVDIINKNGLQMLHNMLKRSRKEFNKIPILRKLLKVFEYLATREILTSEHISGGPNCPGVESFRESILSLTEHIDKQVHQIARNFRDRWIPRSARRHQRDEGRSRYSVHKQQSSQAEKYLETPDCVTTSVVIPTTFDAGIVEGSSLSSGSCRNIRKRKTRWDQSEDLNRVDNHTVDGKNGADDDLPRGFAAPCKTTAVPSEVCSYSSQQSPTTNLNNTCEVASGQPQLRFISCLPVSYGVPLGLVKQVGMNQTATFEGLPVAPGMPFHPFPPLPPYPRSTQNSAPSAVDTAVMDQPTHEQNRSVAHNSVSNSPISRGAGIPALEMPGTVNKLDFQQSWGPNTLGRKYFRSQKWNSSKLGPPWIRNRNNWGFTGNNSRKETNSVGLESIGDKFRDWHERERDMYHHPH